MQHFADFGYVKVANKKLKRLNALSTASAVEGSSVGRQAQNTIDALAKNELTYTEHRPKVKYDIKDANTQVRRDRIRQDRSALTDPLDSWQRPYNDSESAKQMIQKRQDAPRTISVGQDKSKPNLDDFTDTRRNTDPAINATHLGFRKDPFKGYGGMVEEPVDYKKKIIGRGVNRFDMRGGVEP